MATRAVSIPVAAPLTRRRAIPQGWAARVALPVSGMLVVLLALGGLGLGVARMPASISAGGDHAALGDVALSAGDSLESLDPIDPAGTADLPRSDAPIGGLVFVRCTNLWASNADGSNPRRLLTMPGLSSPTLSPEGRTVAFFGASETGAIQVWLAAADGTATRLLGSLANARRPILGTPRGLAWSPDGERLAFSLGPPLATRSGRWSIWTLDLADGSFDRVGIGGSAPFWMNRQLLVAGGSSGSVTALWGRDWLADRLSRSGDVASAGLAPGWWAWDWQRDAALLQRTPDGTLELAWRPSFGRRTRVTTGPPEGYRFDPAARPAVAELGPVAISLLDAGGERDLGLFDPVTERWTILDYAWDPVWSPAPVAAGPIAARRAFDLAHTMLWSLRRPERSGLLLEEIAPSRLVPFGHAQFTVGVPTRISSGGWSVPATALGRDHRGFVAQDLRVVVRPVDGRLAASPRAVGPLDRVETVEDAVALLRRMLTVRVVPPAGLPAGTQLAESPVGAWSWGGRTQGDLSVIAPGLGQLTFHYGSSGFGCGSDPAPLGLETGTSAIATDPSQGLAWNTIAWPAAPNDTSGPFGISGEVSVATLATMAAAMDRERLESRAGG